MSSYHKVQNTVEVELPDSGIEDAYAYLGTANEGYPDPYGCSSLFWALDEAADAIRNKLHDYIGTSNVKVQIFQPQEV